MLPSNERPDPLTDSSIQNDASDKTSVVARFRYRGNEFIEPLSSSERSDKLHRRLPSNDKRSTYTDTQTGERDAMPSSHEDCLRYSEADEGGIQTLACICSTSWIKINKTKTVA